MELLGVDMETLAAHWPNILDIVRQNVQKQAFETWFLPLRPNQRVDGTLQIFCPNPFFLDWFSEHHLPVLSDAAEAYFGQPVQCKLIVDDSPSQDTDPAPGNSAAAAAPAGEQAAAIVDAGVPQPGRSAAKSGNGRVHLNPDYTFDTFVVGSGTKLPHAAAVAVSNNPGEHFNPLFIHGGVGLGKTHLMHAIGHAIDGRRPAKKICYVTAEQFMNDLIFSIQQNRTYDFKRVYRNVDVLLVDDVAFLAGKESTQEEFFHTFNTLYNDKKQIVLTSDRSPKEITTLEERLRSRFEWGLITDIQPPDLETRIAILKKKVEVNNIYIGDDVIQYVAENITNNIRRLEGALIRLLAFASLTGCDINLEMASEVLSSFFQADSKGPVMIADVMRAVSDKLHITVDQIKSKRRTQDIALARQVGMYLARELIGASLAQIGRAFGNRDHTTVLHACQKIRKIAESDPQFRGTLKDIREQLHQSR
jgi:chromosomal replication initiator protein